MKNDQWTVNDVARAFRFEERRKSPTSIYGAESRGEIPAASRLQRGKVSVRCWKTSDIPMIGRKMGFLKPLRAKEIITVYTAKGGVLKSTIAFNIARMCALNGIRTLIVGLDIQGSITNMALPRKNIENLGEIQKNTSHPKGLYHVFFEGISPENVINKTDLPTLDIIPENQEINDLERRMRSEKRQEYLFKDHLTSVLSDYDVVVFDNGPSWNLLVENSLVVATTVLSPAGCDVGTFEALQTNLKRINDFQKSMQITWGSFLIAPTLLEKTNISQEIYGAYLYYYKDAVIHKPIRRGVKGQEAHFEKRAAIEASPKSPLAGDYHELLVELWRRIRHHQDIQVAA